jgi:hypothetical protein
MPDAPHVRELRLIQRTGDPLPDHVRSVVGKSVQLRIPMRDVVDLRRSAEILRGYANRLEVLSRSKQDDTAVLMLQAWAEARTAQARLQSQPGRGRKNDGA